jgi:hypothetical protein
MMSERALLNQVEKKARWADVTDHRPTSNHRPEKEAILLVSKEFTRSYVAGQIL